MSANIMVQILEKLNVSVTLSQIWNRFIPGTNFSFFFFKYIFPSQMNITVDQYLTIIIWHNFMSDRDGHRIHVGNFSSIVESHCIFFS